MAVPITPATSSGTRSGMSLSGRRCARSIIRFETNVGIVITTTASSGPTTVASTGMAIRGRPAPVIPLTKAPRTTATTTAATPTQSMRSN